MASPSGYGTIPTMAAAPPPSASYRPAYAAPLRPWRELADPSALSRPASYPDAAARVRRNASRFRANYALVALVAVFLGLLYRPVSMFVLLAIFAAGWLPLYFSRDRPLHLFRRDLDDRLVLAVLSLLTLVALILTRAGLNVLISLAAAAVVLALHGTIRTSEDELGGDDDGGEAGGLLSVVGGSGLLTRGYSGW